MISVGCTCRHSTVEYIIVLQSQMRVICLGNKIVNFCSGFFVVEKNDEINDYKNGQEIYFLKNDSLPIERVLLINGTCAIRNKQDQVYT